MSIEYLSPKLTASTADLLLRIRFDPNWFRQNQELVGRLKEVFLIRAIRTCFELKY